MAKNVTRKTVTKRNRKNIEDEKEHIALLSGLQSSKVAGSVAEDNKETLDSYAEDIIETPAL